MSISEQLTPKQCMYPLHCLGLRLGWGTTVYPPLRMQYLTSFKHDMRLVAAPGTLRSPQCCLLTSACVPEHTNQPHNAATLLPPSCPPGVLKHVAQRYHAAAADAGCYILPGAGFDYAITDVAAQRALQLYRAMYGEAPATLEKVLAIAPGPGGIVVK